MKYTIDTQKHWRHLLIFGIMIFGLFVGTIRNSDVKIIKETEVIRDTITEYRYMDEYGIEVETDYTGKSYWFCSYECPSDNVIDFDVIELNTKKFDVVELLRHINLGLNEHFKKENHEFFIILQTVMEVDKEIYQKYNESEFK